MIQPEIIEMLKANPKFFRAYHVDPLVRQMISCGFSLPDVVAELAQDRATLQERIAKLDMIRPRVLRLPNGQTLVWHCPDRFIPEEQL